MELLLIFFALPLAVIIISIALQKILKNPILVSSIIFAIGLIVTFIIGNLIILVITIIYTIISYVTAFITYLICKWFREENNESRRRGRNNCYGRIHDNCNDRENSNELLTISSNCNQNNNGNLLTITSNCNRNNNGDLLTINSGCNRNSDSNLLTINSRCGNNSNCCNMNDGRNDLITINSNVNSKETGNWNCSCSQNANVINGVIRVRNGDCSCQNDDIVDTRINLIPNSNNNGRTGCICGKYKRR